MQKSIKPNRLENALKETKNNVSFPGLIPLVEAKDYHLAFIDVKFNEITESAEYKANFQVINQTSFERCKEMYRQLGLNKIVIFHDPTKPYETPEDETKVLNLNSDNEKDEKIKALEAQIEKMKSQSETDAKNAILANENKDVSKGKAKSKKEPEDFKKVDLKTFEVTVDNVVEFAAQNEIDLTQAKNLEEKIAIVNIWLETKLSE